MEELYLHKIIRRLGSKNFEPQIYGALFRNYQGRTESKLKEMFINFITAETAYQTAMSVWVVSIQPH